MSTTYKNSSPYSATGKFGPFLDLLEYRPISKKADDVSYVINSVYKYRPDMLAFDLYGDVGLWWVFAVRNPNVIKDPIFDFVPGVSIYIPKKETLVAELGL
jgi:alpha-L-fucosidase